MNVIRLVPKGVKMGVCYSVMIERRWPLSDEERVTGLRREVWSGNVFFDLGKAYEFARCFPHQGWPRATDRSEAGFRQYAVSQAAHVFYEKEFADTGLQWGSLNEVATAYNAEMAETNDEPRDWPICRAVFAAARALQEAGAEVRLLLWSD